MKKLTELQRELVAENHRLAMHMANASAKWYGRPDLLEDFVAICSLAICRAAIAFDPGRGVRFSTLACTACRRSVTSYADSFGAKFRSGITYSVSDYGEFPDGEYQPEDRRAIAPERAAEIRDSVSRLIGLCRDDGDRYVLLSIWEGRDLEGIGLAIGKSRGWAYMKIKKLRARAADRYPTGI